MGDAADSSSFRAKFPIRKTFGGRGGNALPDGPRPPPLYGHAMENVPGGFVLFGGKSPNGLTSDLWFFNLTASAFQGSILCNTISAEKFTDKFLFGITIIFHTEITHKILFNISR
jgi:hypothetical protein